MMLLQTTIKDIHFIYVVISIEILFFDGVCFIV